MSLVPLLVIALMPPPENPPWRTSYGRDDQLDFLDRVEADRLCFGGAARRAGRARQAEEIVVDRAVDLQRVVAIAVARHRERRGPITGAAALRDEQRADPRDVGQAAGDGRQILFDLRSRCCRPCRRARDRSADSAPGLRRSRSPSRAASLKSIGRSWPSGDVDVLLLLLLEADHRSADRVGADAHVEDTEAAVGADRRLRSSSPLIVCTAVTVAPGRTPPCASVTLPAMLPVVTVCAAALAANTMARQSTASRLEAALVRNLIMYSNCNR